MNDARGHVGNNRPKRRRREALLMPPGKPTVSMITPPLFRTAEAEPGQRQDWALDVLVRGRGGDPGHDASRHIRCHGDVRNRAVAPCLCLSKSNPNIWWCSPYRTGRQRMVPASLTARETGASFSKDKCVLISLCSCTTVVHDRGGARRTQQRGQGTPVGSNRSAVRHICRPVTNAHYRSLLMRTSPSKQSEDGGRGDEGSPPRASWNPHCYTVKLPRHSRFP
jgi:hypothetical protein